MSSAARMALLRAWRGRTVTLTVLPPVISFAERRAVLQVLERYGGVDFFKPLPGHEAMFVSVFKDDEAVEKLLDDSPLSYSVEIPKPIKKTFINDLTAPELLKHSKPTTIARRLGAGDTLEDLQGHTEEGMRFEMTAFPSPDYHHGAPDSTLAGPWPVSYDKKHSFATASLKQSLPKTLANRGFAHWGVHLGRQTEDLAGEASKAGRLKLKDWTPSKMAQASNPGISTRDTSAAHSSPSGEKLGQGGNASQLPLVPSQVSG